MKRENVPLGEMVTILGGGTPSTENPAFWNGDIPWVSPKDMKFSDVGDSIDKITAEAIDNSAASLIPANSTLVVVRSGILARTVPVAITTCPLTVNQDIKALCPKKDINPRFLQYFMYAVEPLLLKKVTRGATVHRLSTDDLKALRFPKLSLSEQRRIVAILDEAFAAIATATANAEKNRENARALYVSALDKAFRQNPQERTNTRVGDICRLINGRAYSKPELLSEGPVPLLRVGNFFTNDQWYYSDLRLDPDKYADDGDLLYAWSASFGPRIWRGGRVIFHYHIWKVEPDCGKIHKQFLFYFFDWDKNRIKLEQGAGTTMVHVSKGSMEARPIGLPSLDEQKKIISRLDGITSQTEQLGHLYRDKIEEVGRLKQSVLNRAFAGDLKRLASDALDVAAE